MKGTALALARHLAAVAAAWLAGTLALSPDQVADVEHGLTIFGAAVMLGVYALAEKALKPVFFRLLGEVQPGEVPPEKHDLELAKAEISKGAGVR